MISSPKIARAIERTLSQERGVDEGAVQRELEESVVETLGFLEKDSIPMLVPQGGEPAVLLTRTERMIEALILDVRSRVSLDTIANLRAAVEVVGPRAAELLPSRFASLKRALGDAAKALKRGRLGCGEALWQVLNQSTTFSTFKDEALLLLAEANSLDATTSRAGFVGEGLRSGFRSAGFEI
jgi:hypothetical protein